ncbi:hypothetical protein BG07_1033 [Bacillus pseudomycoides]|uniref:hypothetical protein n=1 Tax=Bacillus TaxID=1386 RepID=UPI000365875A|nr:MULTISPECIES: hypothetical protein [Bacillus]AIK36836.1 hypothetical protein DJ92_3912 [Bacillus pseudomycoides]AJI16098.1 hypothetical protein BG07_1033 [Bacillus pseudomycoides]
MSYKRHELNLIESFSEGIKQGEDLVKDAELFSVGTHRGQKYEVVDLQRLANNFNAEEQIPIQLDHSESIKDTVGFLEEVKVQGDKLIGKLRVIDEFTKERISKKLMKKLSISFYTNNEGKPEKIREVPLVAFPQVKTAQLFHENGNSIADLQRKADILSREANLLLQYSEIRNKAQRLELGLKQLTKEFNKREAPKKPTTREIEAAKKAQEEFDKFYAEYTSNLHWSN